jgi:hypothetical protein
MLVYVMKEIALTNVWALQWAGSSISHGNPENNEEIK